MLDPGRCRLCSSGAFPRKVLAGGLFECMDAEPCESRRLRQGKPQASKFPALAFEVHSSRGGDGRPLDRLAGSLPYAPPVRAGAPVVLVFRGNDGAVYRVAGSVERATDQEARGLRAGEDR